MEAPDPAQQPELITDDPRDLTGLRSRPRFEVPAFATIWDTGTGSGELSLFSWFIDQISPRVDSARRASFQESSVSHESALLDEISTQGQKQNHTN